MATPSPSDTTSPASTSTANAARTPAALEHENLQRKRARDRKSQKAMRERTKWNIQNLSQQVEQLTHALEMETREKNELYSRFLAVSDENDHLRVQKAALQLRLLGNGLEVEKSGSGAEGAGLAAHEAIPLNTSPSTMSDQILQTFVESRWEAYALQTSGRIESYPEKPDMSALFDGRPNRTVDETSSVVGDIIRSYKEIDTLPKQVAVHYVMSTLMKWQVLRTKASFEAMPEWLRPEPLQLEKAHASWIDRIPWPKVRLYLIEHPEVKFDDFASVYSTSFNIKWDYAPRNVIITTSDDEKGGILINPIYEEHVRQLKNWTVEGVFRRRFPEMTEIVDTHGKAERSAGSLENVLNPMPLARYAI
ncbi:hypothetical protein P280DRAFT_467356 [Massarina eburnea CBS 473.64]|uniref:BZIP domain-containing protein n=1 Tax=Massarina eburnea CBS 473.64 TaxID=1395130 RepID=A0A6A6S983_9PLEO|nr:hypothetical protein P280DRAFT_467356 [Massarina eburnea CBS 473.64]